MPVWAVAVVMSLVGMGTGSSYPVCTVSIQNAVEHRQVGIAMGAMNFFRALASALVVAVMGAIMLAHSAPRRSAERPPRPMPSRRMRRWSSLPGRSVSFSRSRSPFCSSASWRCSSWRSGLCGPPSSPCRARARCRPGLRTSAGTSRRADVPAACAFARQISEVFGLCRPACPKTAVQARFSVRRLGRSYGLRRAICHCRADRAFARAGARAGGHPPAACRR